MKLFVANRFDGIEISGFTSRIPTEEYPGYRTNEERKYDRIGLYVNRPFEQDVDDCRCTYSEDDPDNAAGNADENGFDKELGEDIDTPGSDGHAQPISRVRSVTETYMIFMIPIPPTNNDIPAMQASKIVIMSVVELNMELSSSCERISKSSSSPSFILWFFRRISLISSVA